jgi:hypothetical protein
MSVYPWIVFLHVVSAFVFMLAHGASAAVMFRMRHERDLGSLRVLLDMREGAGLVFNISSGVMFLSGIALGFMGGWWGSGWIWTSLGLLVAITLVMAVFGRRYLDEVRTFVEPYVYANPHPEPEHTLNRQGLEALLQNGKPILLTVIGVGGIIFIIWLMMFKPF